MIAKALSVLMREDFQDILFIGKIEQQNTAYWQTNSKEERRGCGCMWKLACEYAMYTVF